VTIVIRNPQIRMLFYTNSSRMNNVPLRYTIGKDLSNLSEFIFSLLSKTLYLLAVPYIVGI